jgi:hypothetical protein
VDDIVIVRMPKFGLLGHLGHSACSIASVLG